MVIGYAVTMSSVNICLGATKQKAFRHIFWEWYIYYRDPKNSAHVGGQSPPLFLLGWIVVYGLGREYLKQQILGVLKVPKHTKTAKSPIPPYHAHIHWKNRSFLEIKCLGNGLKIVTTVYQSAKSILCAGQKILKLNCWYCSEHTHTSIHLSIITSCNVSGPGD